MRARGPQCGQTTRSRDQTITVVGASTDYAGSVQPLKFQRNSIYEAVVAGGLDAAECNFTYDEVQWRISHAPSQSYFLIRSDPGKYTSTSVVGENPPWPTESYNWASVPDKVKLWAEEVRHDVDTPDLWAELRRNPGVLTGAGYEDLENTPFTPDEQAEILEKLGEIKGLAERADTLSEQQKLSVEAKLDALAEAAARAGRRDWQLMFGGVILGLILQQLVPQEVTSTIVEMVGNGLGHLFDGDGLLVLPLAPPPVL